MAIGYTGDRGDGPRRRRRRGGARPPARGRRPRGATPRRRSNARPGRRRRLAKPRTRVAAETRAKDTSTKRTARSRSGPARTPWTDPGHDTESPASPTGLPVGDDAALCFAHHSSRTGDENQSTRRRGGRGSPRTTSTRLGSGGAILRAAQPCQRRPAAPTARAARAKREA
jgi:hypothetical protein